jgi:hypothetical protein
MQSKGLGIKKKDAFNESAYSDLLGKNDILGNTWCINDENIANLARLKQRQ